jgi:hypothetical protein
MTSPAFRLALNPCARFGQTLQLLCRIAATLMLLLPAFRSAIASSAETASGTVAVDAWSGIAATADRTGTISLFDISAPNHPALLSRYTIPRNLTGIALDGASLLVSGLDGVEVLDISNPRSPQLKKTIELGGDAIAVKAAGNLAYAAVGSSVVLFNVESGEILDRREFTSLPVQDMALAEDNLYVLSASAGEGMELTKLAIAATLGQPLASWKSAKTAADAGTRLSLYAAGDLIYIGGAATDRAENSAGVEVIQDLGGSFKVVGSPSPAGAGTARPSGDGLLAFAASGSDDASLKHIGILDISNTADTGKLLETIDTAGPAYDLTLHGEYAYVAAGAAGLQVARFVSADGAKNPPVVTLDAGNISEAPLAGSLVRLTADVLAADQVRRVDFYINGEKVASDGNYPFEYRFYSADPDSLESATISACAEDIDGNRACSAPQQLNPKASGKLKVLAVTPADGSETPRDSKYTISARFSAALDTSTVSLKNVTLTQLAQGKSPAANIPLASVSYQPATRSILLEPKTALTAGSYRVSLLPAIRGSSGDTLSASYVWNFRLTAATITWTSAISGKWETGANWSGGKVPANGDNVVINKTPGITVTLSTLNPILENLTVGAKNTLTVSGGNLSVVGTGTVTTLNMMAGSIGGPGKVTVSTAMDWTGGVLSGVLDIAAKATLKLTTPFNPNGTFAIAGGTLNNSGTVTQNFLGVPAQYTGFSLSQGATINNLAGGVWNVVSDVWIYAADSSAVSFNNTGTFNKSGGTESSLWSVPFGGSGPINIEIGDLRLNAAFTGTLKSAIAISAKATLDYAQGGTLDGGKVTGAGTMNFDAATIVEGAYSFAGITQIQSGIGAISFQSPASIATLNLISGALAGPGPVTVTGAANWTGGGITGVLDIPAKATLRLSTPFNPDGTFYIAGGTLNNSGTVTQSFAGVAGQYTGFQLSQSGTINNLAGATWNLATDVWIYPGDNSAVAFNNTGTFNKTSGTNTTLWSVPLAGAGAINVESGDLTLNGKFTGTLTSPIAISAKATLDYAQGGTLDGGKVTGAGTMNFDSGTTVSGTYSFAGLTQIQSGAGAISFQGATTIATLNLISGALAGPGPVTVTGATNWTGGGITGVLDIPAKATLAINTPFNPDGTFYIAGGTLNNSGTVTQSFAGTANQYTGFTMSQGGVINNLAGATWNTATDVWIYPADNSAVVFNNAGTFNKVAGTNTSVFNVPFLSTGAFNVESGDLALNGKFTGTFTSSIAISAKATLDYAQGGTLNGGSITGAGTMNFDAATSVTGTYSFAGFTQIQSGNGVAVNFAGATTITTLNLISGVMSGAGAVTISGSMNWTGGGIADTLNIPAKSTLTINTPFNPDGTFYMAGGTLNNSGTVTQSFAGTAGQYTGFTLSQGAVINNLTGGVWNAATDVWIYPADNSAVVFNNTGTFNKAGGTNTSIFSVPFLSSGTFNIQSGDLTLNGKFTGTFTSSIAIASKATVDYAQGGTLNGASITGAGTMNFDASTTVTGTYAFAGLTQIQCGNNYAVNFAGATTIAALNLISGALAGPGVVTVTGGMDWTGGGITGTLDIPTGGTLTISTPFNPDGTFFIAGGTLNNSGTVSQSFAGTANQYTGFTISQGGTINNLAGGVWNLISDVWLYTADNSAVSFNNSGTLNKTGGTGTTIFNLTWNNASTGTINANSGTMSLTGFFPTGTIAGTLNIAASAIFSYAQQGTLTSGKATGSGTFDLTPSGNDSPTNTVTGTWQITVPVRLLGGTLHISASASFNAGSLNVTNGTLDSDGDTSVDDMDVDDTESDTDGGEVDGAGSISVTGMLTWNAGSVSVTGSFDIGDMTLASNSSLSFAFGSKALSISGKVSLDGTLSVTGLDNLPAVGTVVNVLNFANGFLDNFGTYDLPSLGAQLEWQTNLGDSGLSFTVIQDPTS